MSSHSSKDSIDAMHANDAKQGGEHSKHPGADETRTPDVHTKAAGDQRNVIDKEETTSAYRGEFNRGH